MSAGAGVGPCSACGGRGWTNHPGEGPPSPRYPQGMPAGRDCRTCGGSGREPRSAPSTRDLVTRLVDSAREQLGPDLGGLTVEELLAANIPELTRERAAALAAEHRARQAKPDPVWPVCIACGCNELNAGACRWSILNEAMGAGLCAECGQALEGAPGPLVVMA